MAERRPLGVVGGSWIAELRFQDLQILRKVVKKVHLAHYPTEHIKDYEADRVIEAFGPQVAEKMIAEAVQKGLRR